MSEPDPKVQKPPRANPYRNAAVTGVVGAVEFGVNETPLLEADLAAFGHAVRVAFTLRRAAFRKQESLSETVLAQKVKERVPNLSRTLVCGAISQASGLDPAAKVIFGGKRNYERLQKGELSRAQWQRLRDSALFARGDSERQGNRVIRFAGDEIQVRLTAGVTVKGTVRWFQPVPPGAWACYGARLRRKEDGTWQVVITFPRPNQPFARRPGILGVDTNPNCLAVTELDASGNPVGRQGLWLLRAVCARQGKREADILAAAHALVACAKERGKAIGLETVGFGRPRKRPRFTKRYRRFNRMRHNFSYRQVLVAIERRAQKEGVPIVWVPPAYTSILGLAKYAAMYRMNRHQAAAVIIGRRAMGITRERANFQIRTRKGPKAANEPPAASRGSKVAASEARSKGVRKPPEPAAAGGDPCVTARIGVAIRLSAASRKRLTGRYLRTQVRRVGKGRSQATAHCRRGPEAGSPPGTPVPGPAILPGPKPSIPKWNETATLIPVEACPISVRGQVGTPGSR